MGKKSRRKKGASAASRGADSAQGDRRGPLGTASVQSSQGDRCGPPIPLPDDRSRPGADENPFVVTLPDEAVRDVLKEFDTEPSWNVLLSIAERKFEFQGNPMADAPTIADALLRRGRALGLFREDDFRPQDDFPDDFVIDVLRQFDARPAVASLEEIEEILKKFAPGRKAETRRRAALYIFRRGHELNVFDPLAPPPFDPPMAPRPGFVSHAAEAIQYLRRVCDPRSPSTEPIILAAGFKGDPHLILTRPIDAASFIEACPAAPSGQRSSSTE